MNDAPAPAQEIAAIFGKPPQLPTWDAVAQAVYATYIEKVKPEKRSERGLRERMAEGIQDVARWYEEQLVMHISWKLCTGYCRFLNNALTVVRPYEGEYEIGEEGEPPSVHDETLLADLVAAHRIRGYNENLLQCSLLDRVRYNRATEWVLETVIGFQYPYKLPEAAPLVAPYLPTLTLAKASKSGQMSLF